MRALKILVILVAVMGVLLVAGTVTLVTLLVQRLGRADAPLWEAALAQSDNARIGGVAVAEGAVAVWVARPDGDRVVLVDPRRGRVVGEIRLR